jgi:hypothetical protein
MTHYPVGMPEWMHIGTYYPPVIPGQDSWIGRRIELTVVRLDDPLDRDYHDTAKFTISWGITLTDEHPNPKYSDNTVCEGYLNTESWDEALQCLIQRGALM